nr:metallophosphoesterase [Maliibacterium massiliense]
MRILVISDTHHMQASADAALARAGQVDMLVHLGDCVADGRCLHEMLGQEIPYVQVRGNCDSGASAPAEAVFTCAGMTMLAVHGNAQGVRWGTAQLLGLAREKGARVAFYGHTHVPDITMQGRVLLINPGSPALPRQGSAPSCAILELEKGRCVPAILPLR